MAIYLERSNVTLLTGATDGDGDAVTVSRVNGSPGNIGVAVPLAGGSGGFVTVTADGVVTLDDTGMTAPAADQTAVAGSFTFTLTDGDLESPEYTATVSVLGVATTDAPANTVLPSVGGTPRIGATLTADSGSWTGTPSPSYAYQWRRNGANIPGASSASYSLVAADDTAAIRVAVTATNSAGSAVAVSGAVTPTYAAPGASGGLADVTYTQGSGDRTVDAAADFTGAAGGGWSLSFAPAGVSIDAAGVVTIPTAALLAAASVVVRYANSGGEAQSGFSVTVEAGQSAPVNTVAPALSGTARTGQTLTCSSGSWTGSPAPTYAWRWQRDTGGGFLDIPGAAGSSYTPVPADETHDLRAVVTATNASGSASANAAAVTVLASSGADVEAVFGALTLAGQGGVAVTGASISAGTNAAHWQVTGGRIAPSAAGVGNLSGAYALTLNNGETVAITIEAGRRDVRTDAELSAAIAAIDGGVVHLRPGTYAPIQLTGMTKSAETTIRSDPADRTVSTGFGETRTYANRSGQAVISGNSRLISCANLTFRNLRFTMAGAGFFPEAFDASGSQWVVSYRSNTNVRFRRCCVHGDTPASYDYDGGRGLPRGIGHFTRSEQSHGIEITDCLVYNLYVGIGPQIGTGPHSIERNLVLDCYAMWFELKIGNGLSYQSTGLALRSNVCRGCWLSYIDTRRPGTNWPSEHPDGKDIHQASLATQGAGGTMIDWDVSGNIMLPCYGILDGYGTYAGGLDFDGDGSSNNFCRNIRVRGNILVARQETGDSRFHNAQGGCDFIYNTHVPTVHRGQAVTGNWSGPRYNYTGTTTTTHGSNAVYRNIGCGQYDSNGDPAASGQAGVGSGVDVAGNWYGTRTAPAAFTASQNVFMGHAGTHAANAGGVLATFPPASAPGAALGTTAGLRFIDIFNGNNAAGDFCEIKDISGLYQTDAHRAALGFAVGALQQTGSYVTFAPGHLHDPQDAVFNQAMEPGTVETAPANTMAPAISGTALVGQTLTCSQGSWSASPAPGYAFRWQRNTGGGFANITGATASTHTLVAADETHDLRCVVTATNSQGSASANSNTVTVSSVATGPAAFIASRAEPLAFGTATSTTIAGIGAVDGRVAVAIAVRNSTSPVTTAVTIGGVPAAKRAAQVSGQQELSIWDAVVASGNSGVVAVTTSADTARLGVGAWAVGALAFASADTVESLDGTTSWAVATAAGTGDAVIAASMNVNGFSTTYSGATENYDEVLEATIMQAGALNAGAAGGQTVTITQSGAWTATCHIVAVYR
jgi:hypothetical protein